ncbi:hypothetical protein QBC38DRAFT_538803 [Podospora fimiseda]|uniref:Methyltransferase domain-containing protein n=1 Tax=Podospora fimiseda TaxID=252190 RepID=A0AAN7GVX5_9PEZI|nr:hypothetical protein QBC38DRAFT_538803 [Podospora fimiseda]
MPADFEKQYYWKQRFQKEKAFEWLTTSPTFINTFTPYLDSLDPTIEILHLGSGTSDLHNHLRKRGFLNVTNIDYEPLALERRQQLERNVFGDVKTKYRVADVTKLDINSDQPNKCQLIIDKSTIDAVACGGDEAVVAMAQGIYKILNGQNGVWISLSFSEHRFDDERIKELFDVQVVTKVATEKRLESDPDLWHWCYSLRPKKMQQH